MAIFPVTLIPKGVRPKRFKNHMVKGSVNAALRLLYNQTSGGVLPIDTAMVTGLMEKHQKSAHI